MYRESGADKVVAQFQPPLTVGTPAVGEIKCLYFVSQLLIIESWSCDAVWANKTNQILSVRGFLGEFLWEKLMQLASPLSHSFRMWCLEYQQPCCDYEVVNHHSKNGKEDRLKEHGWSATSVLTACLQIYCIQQTPLIPPHFKPLFIGVSVTLLMIQV